MGDCGAFGYIQKANPPYSTAEILDYYTRLGFDAGVSIDHLIVAAIIAMSHALGKSVIAEGVETQKQLAVLRRLGCDEMQGFLLSAALPPDGVGQLVRARSVALSLS